MNTVLMTYAARQRWHNEDFFSVAVPDPGSRIGFFRIPDLGSRIPNPYFWEISDRFFVKKFYNSLKIGLNFFLQHFKNKIIYNFVKFMATKKLWQLFFVHPCLLMRFLDPGSGMGKNQDPGSGITIPEPQHCFFSDTRYCDQ